MSMPHRFRSFALSAAIAQGVLSATCNVLCAQVAQTPIMGWNSYDSYGGFVDQAQVEANAQYMAANLKQYGYNTITIDFCWSYPGDGSGGSGGGQLMQSYPTTNGVVSGQPTPALSMNAYGELLPDPTRFPDSIQNGEEVGFTALAAYIHSLGLQFGIHIMRGIPVQAYYDNTPIAGDPGVTAQQIGNPASQAAWLNQMYGLQTGANGQLTPGAQAYYNGLFDMYASWGVDFVKADDMLSGTYQAADIAGMQQAIAQSGRPMVLSLSPGPAPVSQGTQLAQDSNMWRMVADVSANWNDVSQVFAAAAMWNQYMGPGHWPDADMLPLGTGINPPTGAPGPSGLTHDQQQTVMSLWSIIRSPLIFGGDLPSLATDPFTTALITNTSILTIDQNSLNNHQVSNTNNQVVWEADVQNSNSKYLALFNIGSAAAPVATSFANLGLSATTSYDVKNLWTGADLGYFTGTFCQNLASDASGVYEIINSAPTPKPTWALNSSGDWNILSDWSTGYVPDAIGAEADFFGSITSAHTVFTDFGVTVGILNFNNANTYVIGGAGSLTMEAAGVSAQIIVQSGNPTIALPFTVASNAVFNVASGSTLVISGPMTVNAGEMIMQCGGGTVLYETPLNLGAGSSLVMGESTTMPSLSLAPSASAKITSGSNSVLTVNALAIAPGGTLDLGTNKLVIAYGPGNASPMGTIRGFLESGFNGGTWTGTGLISSAAAANPHYGLAYADGNNPADVAAISGLQPNEVIVQYALVGDAHLTGQVDFSDVLVVAQHYGQSVDSNGNPVDWAEGDFDYSAAVDFPDVLDVASNYDQELTPQQTLEVGAPFAKLWQTALDDVNNPVPEPNGAICLVLGLGGLLRRRRMRAAAFF
jgi:hypothetical protein